MREGIFHDGHPFVYITLPGKTHPITIKFLIDTGFEGDLIITAALAEEIDAEYAGSRERLLADGSIRPFDCYELPWSEDGDEERLLEIVVMESRPLIGTHFFANHELHIELTDGGRVIAEEM
jgi:predicted aspartyl protease